MTDNVEIKLDTLKIERNPDGSFSLIWDPEDPNWSWLNGLTSEQVQVIVEQALDDYLAKHGLQ